MRISDLSSYVCSSDLRPDALVCADDLIALGVLQTCHALGIDVPGDVLVTGFDNIPFSELCNPPLTTVGQPQERIAEEAVRSEERRVGKEGVSTCRYRW